MTSPLAIRWGQADTCVTKGAQQSKDLSPP